jgi:hypothetical protein
MLCQFKKEEVLCLSELINQAALSAREHMDFVKKCRPRVVGIQLTIVEHVVVSH